VGERIVKRCWKEEAQLVEAENDDGLAKVQAPDGRVVDLAPVGQQVLLDNEHARVWEVVLEPGESQPWHRHEHPYLVLAIEPGDNRIEGLDGSVREVHEPVGGVVFREPGEVHKLTNAGSTRYRSRLVELKKASPDRLAVAPTLAGEGR
jgi:quercetin dioxygenase-like cupin family protein